MTSHPQSLVHKEKMVQRNFRRVVDVLCVVVIRDVKHVTIFL